jgi:hypothetical protein
MTAQTTRSFPGLLAERFAKAFEAFVAEVRAAVAAGVLDPTYSSTPGLLMWQMDGLPRLEQELSAIQKAFELYQAGDTTAIVQLARNELGLAKHLDGFPFDFAGSDRARKLDQLETSAVVAAYQLCAATGNP